MGSEEKEEKEEVTVEVEKEEKEEEERRRRRWTLLYGSQDLYPSAFALTETNFKKT